MRNLWKLLVPACAAFAVTAQSADAHAQTTLYTAIYPATVCTAQNTSTGDITYDVIGGIGDLLNDSSSTSMDVVCSFPMPVISISTIGTLTVTVRGYDGSDTASVSCELFSGHSSSHGTSTSGVAFVGHTTRVMNDPLGFGPLDDYYRVECSLPAEADNWSSIRSIHVAVTES